MEYTDQSLCLRLMMWIGEESVCVCSVYTSVKVMDAVVATGRREYKLS